MEKHSKLTDNAQAFLKSLSKNKKITFQAGGGFTPFQNVDNFTQLENNGQSSMMEFDPSLFAPKKPPVLPSSTTPPPAVQNTDTLGTITDVISTINPMAQVGYGVYQLAKSQIEKRKAKKQLEFYNQDLKERKEDIRTNSYVNTPYTKFQAGGQQAFGQMYENMKQYNNTVQSNFEDFYQQLNAQNIQQWKNSQHSGINSVKAGASGVVNSATKLLGALKNGGKIKYQEGGNSVQDEYNKQIDLYSDQFDPNVFLGNSQEQVDPEKEIRMKENEALLNWVMEDVDVENISPIQIDYEEGMDNNVELEGSTPSVDFNTFDNSDIDPISAGIRQSESDGDYSVVNNTTGTTGAYQFHPKYWADQIGQFMGVSGTKEQIMEQFKNNPKAQDAFMSHVVENIYKPEIEKLRPLLNKYGFTDEEAVRLLHYRGLSDAKRRLSTGNFSVSAEEKAKYNNPDILSYIRKK